MICLTCEVLCRKKIYAYARIFWAGHVFRASPNDAEVLHGLQHILEQRLFRDFSLLEASCAALWKPVPLFTTEDNDPVTQVIVTRRLLVNHGPALIHILDEFDSNGWHDDPLYLEINAFSKSDWLNANLILLWLKKMREPPVELFSCWEIYREARRKASDLREDEISRLVGEFDRLSASPEPPFPPKTPFLRRAMAYVARLLWGSPNPEPTKETDPRQSTLEPRVYMI